MNSSKFFSVMVVGDNPEKLMEKYDMAKEVKPYVKYKYLDAEKMHKNAIKVLKQIAEKPELFGLTKFQTDAFKDQLHKLENLTPFEYYQTLTAGLFYDKNGNAMSEENPDGKWATYRLGKNFSLPLILNDGTETYQALNKDVDWSKMHLVNDMAYRIVWRMVVEGEEPQNDEQKVWYENMKNKSNYFANFKDEDDYATYNTSYWNYAYLDKDGWKDVDDEGDQMEWISKYYYRFIENLKPDDKITIFECTREDR